MTVSKTRTPSYSFLAFIFLSLIPAFAFTRTAAAQDTAASLQAVKQFFEAPSHEQSLDFLCCDMLDSGAHNPGLFSFYKRFQKEYKLMYQRDSTAFVYVLLKDTIELDINIFLQNKNSGWKILISTGSFMHERVYDLGRPLNDSVKARIIQQGFWDIYLRIQQSIRLYFAPGRVFIDYLLQNRENFMSVVRYTDSLRAAGIIISYYDSLLLLNPSLPSLHIFKIHKDRYTHFSPISSLYPDVTFFEPLGGMFGERGFFYAEDRAIIPQPDDPHFLYIREVSPGWYIYRQMYYE